MPKLPVVAIIGRPNTGKSTLFNRLIGKRKAIESTIPGTTRDHISHRIDGERMSYLLLDTGGIGTTRDKDFERDVAEQSLIAIENADLILFTVNGKEPVTKDDLTVVNHLRKKRKNHVPIIVVITKADVPGEQDEIIHDYHEVHMGDAMIAVSATHNIGIDALREQIENELRGASSLKPQASRNNHLELAACSLQLSTNVPRIAIVGRPNVGKSSIVNALMSPAQRSSSPPPRLPDRRHDQG